MTFKTEYVVSVSIRGETELTALTCKPKQPLNSRATPSSQPKTQLPATSDSRRFNIIIFGVPEQQHGLPRHLNLCKDPDSVSSAVDKVEGCQNCTRDCCRLGRYSNELPQPRPLLATLNSTANVHNLLTSHRSLPTSIAIKPDLSPEDQKSRINPAEKKTKTHKLRN